MPSGTCRLKKTLQDEQHIAPKYEYRAGAEQIRQMVCSRIIARLGYDGRDARRDIEYERVFD